MSIEKLKEQARRHEQKEEWHKALDQYRKAIEKLAESDQPDIGLYNRVGDLYVRVGNLADAVEHYEQAIDLYMEAELPNNAIAVCKKVIRNVPDRHSVYLKMGRIRAGQGFLPDARVNFLTYAERMAQEGDLDESLRALAEFTELAPEDVDLRLFVAEQMAAHERADEAVEQLSAAYRTLMQNGEAERAAEVEARVRELNPDADLAVPPEPELTFERGSGIPGVEEGIVAEFGEIDTSAAAGVEEAHEEEAGVGGLEGFDISVGGEEEEEEAADEAVELPLMEFGSEDEDEEAGEEPAEAFGDETAAAEELPSFDFEGEEEAEALPTFGLEDEDEGEALPTMDLAEEEAEDLPLMTFDDEEGEGAEEVVLDAAAFGEADHGDREVREYIEGPEEMEEVDVGLSLEEPGGEDAGEPAPPAGEAGADEEPEVAEAVAEAREEAAAEAREEAAAEAREEAAAELSLDDVRAALEERPDDVSLHQRMVELAYGSGDESRLVEAYLGLGRALSAAGEAGRARAAFQQVLHLDPGNEEARAGIGEAEPGAQPVKEVASHEDYVDLGALILGDEDEKTTRFVVAYEEPSGDEEADFAKMLSQFKEKVSENLDADDVRAHHDLGTAYKEMGLLDEAIAEFQQALRASGNHLPTYELMGQTFLEMGQPEAAVRSLERALQAPYDVEDELVGIYYYLGRAHEALGNTEGAVEFYDRVFSLDINFADVTERLRALR